MTETAVKHFTLEEANATLPYVARIVQDIVAEYEQWRDCIFRYEQLGAEGSETGEGESEEQTRLRLRVDASARRINGFIDELTDVGCVFKGFEGGLVDFHSRKEGRDILQRVRRPVTVDWSRGIGLWPLAKATAATW